MEKGHTSKPLGCSYMTSSHACNQTGLPCAGYWPLKRVRQLFPQSTKLWLGQRLSSAKGEQLQRAHNQAQCPLSEDPEHLSTSRQQPSLSRKWQGSSTSPSSYCRAVKRCSLKWVSTSPAARPPRRTDPGGRVRRRDSLPLSNMTSVGSSQLTDTRLTLYSSAALGHLHRLQGLGPRFRGSGARAGCKSVLWGAPASGSLRASVRVLGQLCWCRQGEMASVSGQRD